jgi:hypothetical protein
MKSAVILSDVMMLSVVLPIDSILNVVKLVVILIVVIMSSYKCHNKCCYA